MIDTLYDEEIEEAARTFGLDKFLVTAVVFKESSGIPEAHNPEPPYKYLWDVRKNTPFRALTPEENASEIPPLDFFSIPPAPQDAEWWDQQASWGLLQIMGAVAREPVTIGGKLYRGLLTPYLTELCKPRIGLYHGCRYLAKCTEWAGGKIPLALCIYNGGPSKCKEDPPSNKAYADAVIALWAKAKS